MMKRLARILLCLAVLFPAGCTSRHVVTERDAGRVDSAKSITSNSDLQWKVEHEPASEAR